MGSPWSNLQRPPLSAARLARVTAGGGVWREVRLVASTASTHADVAAAARAGEPAGLVVVAEEQTAGRGRGDRQWLSPPRASVLASALLRPEADVSTWPLLPLLVGLAAVEAVVAVGDVDGRLKWPNDVLVGGRKLAGVLCERVDDAVVVSIGLNVSTRPDELATDTATSLAIAGGVTDRESVAKEILRALARRYLAWQADAGGPDSVVPAYRERCETIGSRVALALPGGDVVRGVAASVDDHGRLVVTEDSTGREQAWLAGDVTHVRKAG